MSTHYYSSLSAVDMSWANTTLLEFETNIPDYEECQTLCKVIKTTFSST